MKIINTIKCACPKCNIIHELYIVTTPQEKLLANSPIVYKAEYLYCSNTDSFLITPEMVYKNYNSLMAAYGIYLEHRLLNQIEIDKYEKLCYHPGYYINILINEWKISIECFAKQLNLPLEILNKLLCGKININKDISKRLSNFFHTTPNIWKKLQLNYSKNVLNLCNYYFNA